VSIFSKRSAIIDGKKFTLLLLLSVDPRKLCQFPSMTTKLNYKFGKSDTPKNTQEKKLFHSKKKYLALENLKKFTSKNVRKLKLK